MDLNLFLENETLKDPSWKRALVIVSEHVRLPSQAWSLIRSGWRDDKNSQDFLRLIGFSRLPMESILRAAKSGLCEVDSDQKFADMVKSMGPKLCCSILAINYLVSVIMKSNPPQGWQKIFAQMSLDLQIGAKLGSHSQYLGKAGGLLVGFSLSAGMGILMAHDKKRFRELMSMTGGAENPKLETQVFGCAAYQLSAFALQQMGFGADVAFGIALATGRIDTKLLDLEPDVLKWKAAYEWLSALKEGRNFPRDVEYRNMFVDLKPPSPGSGNRNTNLEVLYTEIAATKRSPQSWTWFLPSPKQ